MHIAQGEYSAVDEECNRSSCGGGGRGGGFDRDLEIVIFDGAGYESFGDFYVQW